MEKYSENNRDWTLKTVSEIAFCFILATAFKPIVIRTWFTETILVPIISFYFSSKESGALPQPKSHTKYEMKKKFENIIIKRINAKLDIIYRFYVWFGFG